MQGMLLLLPPLLLLLLLLPPLLLLLLPPPPPLLRMRASYRYFVLFLFCSSGHVSIFCRKAELRI